MKRNANQIKSELESFILDYANEIIDETYSGVRKRTPVRKGTARAGWEKQNLTKLGDSAGVGNDVDYIVYLEDGTVKMSPRNMVKRTLQDIERKLK